MADIKDDIQKYLRGEMSAAEMHALEKKALSDPFLADALEGAESIGAKEFAADLTELDRRILKGKGKNSWFWPLRIAASFLVITAAALLVYNSFSPDQPEKLAEQKTIEPPAKESSALSEDEKKVDENLLSLNQPKQEASLKKEKQDLAKIDETPTAAPTVEEAPAAKYGQGALITDEIKAEEESKPAAEDLREEISTTLAESKKEIALDKDEPRRAKSTSPASTEHLAQRRVQGRVTSADDNAALSGVNVTVKGSSIGTVTDAEGNYSVQLPTDTSKLQFSAFDRKSRDVSGRANLDVKLKKDEEQHNEVVVTGFELTLPKNETAGSVSKLAAPVIGRTAVKKYLEENLHYPNEALQRKIEGKVVIEFLVLPDGSLTDFRVLKGIGFGCDEEVIRLIKEGSAWTPTLKDNVPLREKVKVQLRFKLP